MTDADPWRFTSRWQVRQYAAELLAPDERAAWLGRFVTTLEEVQAGSTPTLLVGA